MEDLVACPSFCRDPECKLSYAAHMSFYVAAAARPTTGRGVAVTERKERELRRDLDAYKSLRGDGLQPPATEGAHRLMQSAECAEHVETGLTHVKPRAFEVFHEETGRKATEPAL